MAKHKSLIVVGGAERHTLGELRATVLTKRCGGHRIQLDRAAALAPALRSTYGHLSATLDALTGNQQLGGG
jgi:hypothetical protein